jgi:DNA-binding MarR family transcriptional regulator
MGGVLDTTCIDRGNARSITDGLFRVSTSLDAFTSQIRRSLKLNAHERLALAALWANGAMTMSELGAWIPLSRAAVTTLVDRLEAVGLVSRGADASDRRRIVVEVSEPGLDRMVPVIAGWSDDISTCVGALDESEWQVVGRFLEQLSRISDEHADTLKQLTDAQIQQLAAPVAAAQGSHA